MEQKTTKVFCISAKNEFELVKKMNEEFLKRKVFASQPIPTKDDWVCFVYY